MHRPAREALLYSLLLAAAAAQQPLPTAGASLDVEPVWSGHPVGYCLWTEGELQLVGYYDAERRMSIASRRLGERQWQIQKLPSKLGWDSHNAVTMAVDPLGNIHVVGNLHAQPLVYFRTRRPLDVTSFARVAAMVGEREGRMTYPLFLQAPDGRLVFRYRDGQSGNGDDILNVFDHTASSWSRLVDRPLLSGEGQRNGYFTAPQRGPDGRFHIVGIWRDEPDCATNHDVSYARSRDLVHWERADGRAVPLPMTVGSIDVVDPVPAHGGAINNNVALGFDRQQRPIVSYHKYDAEGHTRIYCARCEGGQWRIHPVGDFGDYRWQFGGGGSIVFEVHLGAVQLAGEGRLQLHANYPGGTRNWLLDEATLAVVGEAAPREPLLPPALRSVESSFPGMQRRTAADTGHPAAAARFLLVWETLGPNRDRPRQGELPPPSMLRVVALPTAK